MVVSTVRRDTALYLRALGCLIGGVIGDAMGTPAEGKDYRAIEAQFGWIDDFTSDGTDDTIMRNLLAEALIRTDGYATYDDWAAIWLDRWDAIFGPKVNKFFISVLHTLHKVRRHAVPRMAALGNMPSSSSAMCIAPVGIVNAGHPRAAAAQAYNLASLIHVHDVGFCQDGAAAMAAGVAAAFVPGATVESVLDAATGAIVPLSGEEMRTAVEAALALARETSEYRAFRETVYAQSDRYFRRITCDARETVPLALAIFALAEGSVERSVVYGANFGRDADTIATMAGALAGALQGLAGIKEAWQAKVRQYSAVDCEDLAERLVEVAVRKHEREREAQATFAQLIGSG